jgi:hypothetical protein
MPIVLNGEEELRDEHLALLNQSAIDHIIPSERAKQYPYGTDFLGVQHAMTRQDPTDPYTVYPLKLYPRKMHFLPRCSQSRSTDIRSVPTLNAFFLSTRKLQPKFIQNAT